RGSNGSTGGRREHAESLESKACQTRPRGDLRQSVRNRGREAVHEGREDRHAQPLAAKPAEGARRLWRGDVRGRSVGRAGAVARTSRGGPQSAVIAGEGSAVIPAGVRLSAERRNPSIQ